MSNLTKTKAAGKINYGRHLAAILLILFGLALAACQPVESPPAITEQAGADSGAASTPTPAPTIPPETKPQPEEAIYYRAMREGFEEDVAAQIDAPRYWLEASINKDPTRIVGEQQIQYTNATGDTLDEIVFRLYPNSLTTEQTLLVVDEIMVNGEPATSEVTTGKSVLRVDLTEPLPPGDQVMIEMAFDYQLPPDIEVAYGRYSDIDGVVSVPSFFPLLSVYENGEWWDDLPNDQGDPGYGDIALFDVTLTVPSTLEVAASGTLLEKNPRPNGTTIYHIVSGPIRDFALGFSRDFELLSDTRNGVTVNIWAAFADEAAREYALEKSFDVLEIYDKQFGSYPYNELDIIEAPVSALGIEYPGVIYMADRIWEADSGVYEWVLAHEIAHQWWYALIGNDQVNEPWLDEGLAEYSVQVYHREFIGPRAEADVESSYRSEFEQYIEENSQMPVGLPTGAYEGYAYRVFVYSGGALLYGQLADQFGREAVDALLQVYYKQYRYKIAHTDDVRRLVEELMGPSAASFFDFWVSGS